MQQAYRDDLAYIHDAGFGHLARTAASFVTGHLRLSGIQDGTVVDLGCGSGITARLLCDAGFSAVGIDLSEALIQMARARVPEADFRVESFVTAVIPACVAVTGIGEVFSYAFDNANNNDTRAGVLGRIYGALIPGGVLVFDIAGPNRAPSTDPQRTFREGTDWAVLVETEADQDYKLLTRRITTFRKRGEWYRRDFEIHQLQLLDPVEVLKMLQCIGFSAQVLDRYGTQVLPRGVTGFLARKVPA